MSFGSSGVGRRRRNEETGGEAKGASVEYKWENPGAVRPRGLSLPLARRYLESGRAAAAVALGCLGALQVPSAVEIWGRAQAVPGQLVQGRQHRGYQATRVVQAASEVSAVQYEGEVPYRPDPPPKPHAAAKPTPALARSGAPSSAGSGGGRYLRYVQPQPVSVWHAPKPGRAGECES